MARVWSSQTQSVFENLRLELRRGSLILAVLGALGREQYGYTLRKSLAAAGMPIDEGTLYPLLRRLEAQGLLESQWREEDKRKKRFYRLTAVGSEVFARLNVEWQQIGEAVASLHTDTNAGELDHEQH
jgi:PadR family transcriptional regulator, regulatory protein PadR